MGVGVIAYNFQTNIIFLSLTIQFVLANSTDPDEMPHYAAFHLGLTVCISTDFWVSLFALVPILYPVPVLKGLNAPANNLNDTIQKNYTDVKKNA